jgi:hypothetical protein
MDVVEWVKLMQNTMVHQAPGAEEHLVVGLDDIGINILVLHNRIW